MGRLLLIAGVLLASVGCSSPTSPGPLTLWRALSSPCAPTLPLPQVLSAPVHVETNPLVFGYLIGVWDTPDGRLAAVYHEIGGLYHICHWQRA